MKKVKNKQAKRASAAAKAENLKHSRILVKNADGEPDTTADIVVQNHIEYTPKVSVIIPVYNVEAYLRECLDSVINQTLKDIEIICVDDGSTDKSLDILKEYAAKDNRITILKQQNLHAGVARNAGLSQAKGEYIHFLDSDDWIDLDTYAKLYRLIEDKNVPVLKFRSYTYDSKKETIVNSYFTNMGAIKEEKFNSFLSFKKDYECLINVSDAPWSGIYNRQFLVENKALFDNLLCANDTSFFYRCIVNAKKIYLSSERFVYYRINNSKSLIGIRPYHFDCQIKQFFTIEKIIEKNKSESIKAVRKHLIHAIFYRYVNYLKNDLLETKAKDKIRQEVKEFHKHIKVNEVAEEYIRYYNDARYDIKVSIIMPVYNAEQYLEESLNSLMNQTLKEIEIICVDDCSTDNSLKILQKYSKNDKRIKVINNEKNTGAPGAVKNIGMKHAIGNYIGFVDSDDYVDTNYFEELYNLAIKNDADISATKNIVRFSEIKTDRTVINCDLDILVTPAQKQELMQRSGSNCNKIYSRSMLDNYIIKCYEKRNIAEDNYFSMLAMVAANKIVLTDKVSYYYRRHENSVTSEKRGKKDFLIFEVYELIEKQVYKICDKKEKDLYIETIRARELQDFSWFRNDCREEDVPLFKKELKNKFPVIYAEMFCDDTIIISLTSYPARIDTVNQTIETLLKQSMKADKVILWLAPEQFPNKEADLPQQLLDLREKGLTIDWYHDIKSYKKLIPTLKKYPDAIIITADDDLLYDRDWLKRLYISYEKEPQYIHCHRITRVYYINGKLKVVSRDLYTNKNGNYISEIRKPSAYNKLSGGAGALFPPHCFTDEVLNEDKFMELAPTSDDIWFWLMGLYNGYKVKVVDNNIYKLDYVPDTQEVGLCRINDTAGHKTFYEHLNNILGAYNKKLKPVFEADYAENQKICDMLFSQNLIKNQEKLSSWYQRVAKERIDINNPRTFNEKIQWMKLYDSTPIKTKLADKYLVRDWVKDKIGEEYLIPLLGVYDKFEDIDFAKLPKQFVIKCNHGCAYNIIVKDKSQLDLADVKAKLDKWMHENFGLKAGAELHYRDIEPKIIIEKFIENKGTDDLYDYKFWCFGGKLYYIQFLSERNLDGLKMAYYDRNWNKQTFVYSHPLDTKIIEKPDNLDLMIKLAEKLAAGFSHVRVDFYRLNDGKIYFGEMTFTSASGVCLWNENGINEYFGSLIKLPKMAYNIDTGKYYKYPWLKNKLHNIIMYPYNKYIAAFWENKKNLRNISSEIWHKVDTFRLDIKNTGTADNATQISGNNVNIINPAWYNTASGKGQIVSGIASRQQLKIKAIKGGRLRLAFRGMDRRYNGERFPVWIDYKSIRINGKEILSAPVSAWHDAPFNYSLPVKNGEIIKLDFVQEAHKYSLAELKDLVWKLGSDKKLLAKRINRITKRVNKKIQQARKKNDIYLHKGHRYHVNTHLPSLYKVTYKNCKKIVHILGLKFTFTDKHAQLLQQILELQKQVESDKQTILRLMENIKADNKKSYAELKKLLSK